MCGYLFCDTTKFSADDLILEASLRLRGPDQENIVNFKSLYFHHFRLQIVGDMQHGIQPIESEEYILVFNGEIYNFKDLCGKYHLSRNAFISDTICLSEIIHKVGANNISNILPEIVGHYSFILYSKRSERLYFMRDQMGVKPLYFSKDFQIISSDIRTIASSLNVKASNDLLLENIIFGGLSGERTIYPDISTCLPGMLYSYDLKTNSLSISEICISKDHGSEARDIGDLISSSISSQIPYDIPFFNLVSSGIDSRLIKKIVSCKSDCESYTLGIGIYQNLEQDLCTEEGTRQVLLNELMHPYHYYNQLMSYGEVPAHNNYFALSHIYAEINQISSANYKVALVGEGADEYFGGYGRYLALSSFLEGNSVEWISCLMDISHDMWLLMMNTRLSHINVLALAKSGINIRSILETRYSHLPSKPSDVSLNNLSLYDRQTNLLYGLRKQDVSSMLSSIEARTPYVIQQIHAISHQFIQIDSAVTKRKLRDYALINGIDQSQKIGFPVKISQITDSFEGVYYDKTEQLAKMAKDFDLPMHLLLSDTELEVSFLLASLFC